MPGSQLNKSNNHNQLICLTFAIAAHIDIVNLSNGWNFQFHINYRLYQYLQN